MEKMNLTQFQRLQNKHFWDIYYDDLIEQDFATFISEHPNLYAGVNLTSTEIDYINNHFWLYKVDPRTFEIEFEQALRESIPRYNNMKAEELVDEIFDTVTDKTIRHLTQDRIGKLQRNNTLTRNQTNTTSQDNRNANRDLPMESTGNSFDNTVNWGDGASNISENKTSGTDTINGTDLQALIDNTTDSGNDWETIDRTTMPVVDLIDKIWGYLLKPKSLDYLTSALAKCFILVY